MNSELIEIWTQCRQLSEASGYFKPARLVSDRRDLGPGCATDLHIAPWATNFHLLEEWRGYTDDDQAGR
jgi:hypothetical protein